MLRVNALKLPVVNFPTIMLINFFIAVMASSVATMAKRRHIAVYMQRAGIAFLMEYRLKWLLKGYYNYMTQRSFVYEENEVFLIETKSYIELHEQHTCNFTDGDSARVEDLRA